MKKFTGVIGTMEQVPTLEVNVSTVYVRSNVKQIDFQGMKAWQYDEIQYDLREYQAGLGEKATELENNANVIAELVATTTEDGVQVAETLATILEDTMTSTEMLTMLLEQNEALKKRIEVLEQTKGLINIG